MYSKFKDDHLVQRVTESPKWEAFREQNHKVN
jgi:hypothetical protein